MALLEYKNALIALQTTYMQYLADYTARENKTTSPHDIRDINDQLGTIYAQLAQIPPAPPGIPLLSTPPPGTLLPTLDRMAVAARYANVPSIRAALMQDPDLSPFGDDMLEAGYIYYLAGSGVTAQHLDVPSWGDMSPRLLDGFAEAYAKANFPRAEAAFSMGFGDPELKVRAADIVGVVTQLSDTDVYDTVVGFGDDKMHTFAHYLAGAGISPAHLSSEDANVLPLVVQLAKRFDASGAQTDIEAFFAGVGATK